MSRQSFSNRRNTPSSRLSYDLGSRVQALTLEEMYTGTHKKFLWPKTVYCVSCEGSGHGMVSVFHYQDCEQCENVFGPCEMCLGRRKALIPQDRCVACNGWRKITEEIYLEAIVKRGVQDGQIVTARGYNGNGSLCELDLIIRQIPHDRFTRIGNDLHVNAPLNCLHALNGFKIILPMLGNQRIEIVKSYMVRNDQIDKFEGKGFPIFENSNEKGDLYVKYKYELPDSIDPLQARTIANILGQEHVEIPPGAERVHMHDMTPQNVYDRLTGEMVILDDGHHMTDNAKGYHDIYHEEDIYMDIDDQDEGARGFDREHHYNDQGYDAGHSFVGQNDDFQQQDNN